MSKREPKSEPYPSEQNAANGRRSSASGTAPQASGDRGSDVPLSDLEQLRKLLLEPEREQLDRLEQRLSDPTQRAQDVGGVLAEAIRLRSDEDHELGDSLAPTIEESLRASVRKNPKNLVDAIFPVLGPAIRMAISDTLARMLQSLNQTLEHGLSPRALRWRLEAWRTGKPFAEVVMLNTLEYRVEQVFLIHTVTGLPLQHVESDVVISHREAVTGMLTAIQDFVRDSFGGKDDATLDSMRVGEFTVWVCPGPHAVLAAVIRGTPPLELRAFLAERIEAIHLEHAAALEAFDGDATPLESCRPDVETCLQQAARTEQRSKPVLAIAVLTIVVGLLAWWWISASAESARWTRYLDALESEPGVVVTRTARSSGRFKVSGLRDPLSRDPATLLAKAGLDADSVDTVWEPYHAAHPDLVRARARGLLGSVDSVEVRFDDGVLVLSGQAPSAWIAEAREVALAIAGVVNVDTRALAPIDQNELILDLARARLDPPAGVTLSYDNGVLKAVGAAGSRWIAEARVLARVLPNVQSFDDDRLIANDKASRILERARAVLDPPPTIELAYEDGTLVLAGSATETWIERAATLARTVPGVEAVHDKDIIATDRSVRILDLAGRILEPPATVSLALRGTTLTVSGAADENWLERARDLAVTLDGVSDLDAAELTVVDSDARIREQAVHLLQPPASMQLTVEAGTLIATGSAPHRWIQEARVLARVIPGVADFHENDLEDEDLPRMLLDRARVALLPPATVELAVEGRTLVARGSASHAWSTKARRLTPSIEGLETFDDSGLRDADRERLLELIDRIEAWPLYFARGSTDLDQDSRNMLPAVAAAFRDVISAAAECETALQIRVIGNSSVSSPRGTELSAQRAAAVIRLLSERGVRAAVLQAEAAGVPAADDAREALNKERQRRVVFDVLLQTEIP